MDWRWYDYLPGMPFWICLGVLLLLLKVNKARGARIAIAVLLAASVAIWMFT